MGSEMWRLRQWGGGGGIGSGADRCSLVSKSGEALLLRCRDGAGENLATNVDRGCLVRLIYTRERKKSQDTVWQLGAPMCACSRVRLSTLS